MSRRFLSNFKSLCEKFDKVPRFCSTLLIFLRHINYYTLIINLSKKNVQVNLFLKLIGALLLFF